MKSLISLVTLIISLSAIASKDAGNGGIGVYCGGHQKTELLDLYEGREALFGDDELALDIPYDITEDVVLKRVETRLEKFNKSLLLDFRKYLKLSKENLRPLKKSVPNNPYDVNPIVSLPSVCRKTVLINFRDEDDILLFRPDFLKNLYLTDATALIVHEALYKLARIQSRMIEDSDDIRRIVAYLLSTKYHPKKLNKLLNLRFKYLAYNLRALQFDKNSKGEMFANTISKHELIKEIKKSSENSISIGFTIYNRSAYGDCGWDSFNKKTKIVGSLSSEDGTVLKDFNFINKDYVNIYPYGSKYSGIGSDLYRGNFKIGRRYLLKILEGTEKLNVSIFAKKLKNVKINLILQIHGFEYKKIKFIPQINKWQEFWRRDLCQDIVRGSEEINFSI